VSQLEWPAARAIAAAAGAAAAAAAAHPAQQVSLADALGRVLARPVVSSTDLPPFDSAAMDGWALADRGPWRVSGRVLAGHRGTPLHPGQAVEIATGAPLPAGADAVLRREDGRLDGGLLHGPAVADGTDVRPRARECRAGELLLEPGVRVTPAVLGLAAAAGCDRLGVTRTPVVTVLVLGDELLLAGVPDEARVRDALGPMLPGWIRALGAAVRDSRHLPDEPAALGGALDTGAADVVVTTGGSARGPLDQLHPVLDARGAHYLVDGVLVRPGHPQVLARLADGRLVVGLPGNPLAAVSGVMTLLEPLLRAMAGERDRPLSTRALDAPVTAHPEEGRLVPVRAGHPLRYAGPAMLRGLALADALAVVPPTPGDSTGEPGTGGGPQVVYAGTEVEVLPLPW